MLLEVPDDERLYRGCVVRLEIAATDEMIDHRPGLSHTQAWNAATSCPWLIRPIWSANIPKSKSRMVRCVAA